MALIVRLFIQIPLLALLGLLVACGDMTGFKANEVKIEDFKFEKAEPRKPIWTWIQRDSEVKTIEPELEDEELPKVDVIYGKLHFDKLSAGTNSNGLTLKGDFYFDKKKIAADVQFETVEVDGYKQFLNATDPNLSEALKASVTCLEDTEDGLCDEFFIDFYYSREDKIYSDQFTLDKETEAAVEAAKDKKQEQPVATIEVPKAPNSETEDESEEDDHNLSHAEAMEGDGVIIKHGAYVGTPILDLWKLFFSKKTAPPITTTTSTTSTTTTTTLPPKSPKNPIPKPAPGPPTSSTTTTSTTTTSTTSTTTTTRPPEPAKPNRRAVKDQSLGKPQRGSIVNSTDFKAYANQDNAVFKMLNTEQRKFYGNFNLLTVVNDMGKFIQTQVPGYKIGIKDISAEKGGYIRHKSHQNGLDADVRYITKSDGPSLINVLHAGKVKDDLQLEPQWETFKRLVATNWVVMIYVDQKIKEALCTHFTSSADAKIPAKVEEAKRIFKHLDGRSGGHHNHFHLRIKCGDNQPRCRVDTYEMPIPACLK